MAEATRRHVEVHLSVTARGDLSGEIYGQLRRGILDGRMQPGDALPPTRELARQLGISRTTVTVAYDRLWSEGLVSARVGAGTFVSRDLPTEPLVPSGNRRSGLLCARPVWDEFGLPRAFAQPAEFDFRTGMPDTSLFPYAAWRRLLARQLRRGAAGAGGYTDPAGQPALREAIARHIGVARGVAASPEDIVVTSGTQQAVDLVARVLLAPGDVVAVESPGYVPPRSLLQSLGARVVGVPVDREGLVVEQLPVDARLVYITPSHQYPLGVRMSLGRRLALLDWALRHHAAVVEDDYDSEFRFGGRPIEPLQALDRQGLVIYVGSFSKTLLPSLRLGFLLAPPSLRNALRKAKYVADWHAPSPLQAALAAFIDAGDFARHVRKMKVAYRRRHELVVAMLAREFAEHLELVPSAAGLHVSALARRASVAEIEAVARRAGEASVAVQRLAAFAAEPPATAGLVLGYGAIRTDQIEEGLRRLRSCFSR